MAAQIELGLPGFRRPGCCRSRVDRPRSGTVCIVATQWSYGQLVICEVRVLQPNTVRFAVAFLVDATETRVVATWDQGADGYSPNDRCRAMDAVGAEGWIVGVGSSSSQIPDWLRKAIAAAHGFGAWPSGGRAYVYNSYDLRRQRI